MNSIFSEEEKLSFLQQHECTTKDAVLLRIRKKQEKCKKKMEEENTFSTVYNSLLCIVLEAFYEKVKSAILFDELPRYWAYYLDYSYDEFSLNLCHIDSYEVDNNGEILWTKVDASYKLIYIRPKAFTPEQYAQFYSVEQGTIRQWIRRGKIRTAYKEGTSWKIPELTPPPSRGYESAQYKWTEELLNLPEEYQYLNDYVFATFFQDQKNKNTYHILLISKKTFETGNMDGNKELVLTACEREKLELFMISHPQIRYCGKII